MSKTRSKIRSKSGMIGAALAASLATLLAGCAASGPSFEGTWRSVEVPAAMPAGSEGRMVILDDGTYTVSFADGSGRTFWSQNGVWEGDGEAGESIIAMTQGSDDDQQSARGVIDAEGRLIATSSTGESAVFERVEK